MNQISNQFLSIEQITDQYLNKPQTSKTTHMPEISFQDVLRQKQNESVMESSALKFSKHASERLNSRNIDLSEAQKERLSQAVKAAEAKGIKESLVMMDNLAFIVNVKNNTVITAVAGGEEKIFSNIDGAVVV